MPKVPTFIMGTNRNLSPIGIAQKRLTIVVIVLGLIGCIALGLVWRDSHENITAYSSKMGSFSCYGSAVRFIAEPLSGLHGYTRVSMKDLGIMSISASPIPKIKHGSVRIPIYLLILTYLATLLLIWLILMNRLARRHFKTTTSIPSQD